MPGVDTLDATDARLGLAPDRVTVVFPVWRTLVIGGAEQLVPRWGVRIDGTLIAWTASAVQADRWVQLLTEPVGGCGT